MLSTKGFNMFGITFAPIFIPLKRRLQTSAVLFMASAIFLGHTIGIVLLLLMFLSKLWPLAVLYASWILLVDYKKSSVGGRRSNLVRNLRIWKHFCEYFPLSLVRTAYLDPKQNYIFGYHPHGVISTGAFGNFGTEGTEFSKVFPGIKPHLLTLKLIFRFPFFRELMMSFGICDVSKESIINICTKQGGGNAAIIVVGGAAESLDAHPGSTTLTLKDRKGFVRMAIMTGASLVPVFSFGENEVFAQVKNPRGSWIRSIQIKFMKLFSFAPVFFHGRGIFQYNFGFLPYRHKVTTVVGSPIPVRQIKNPTMQDIDQVHKTYVKKLMQLFDQYKGKHADDPRAKLIIN